MKTTVLPGAFKKFLPVILCAMCLTGFSQSRPELVFMNPQLVSGIANKEGAVYRFSNVTTGIDAEVKLKKFSRPDIVMQDIDLASLGWDKAFQPQFGLAGLVLPLQHWYIDFEMTFYNAGTSTKQSIDTVDITALDVDGDGLSISEYVTYDNPNSISYSTVSYLTSSATGILGQVFECDDCHLLSVLVSCVNCGGDGLVGASTECPVCEGSGMIYIGCGHAYEGGTGNTMVGPVNNFMNIDTTATQVMATYQYLNRDRIKFRYGAKSNLNASNGAGIRLNSTWFRQFELGPVIVLPVELVSFSAMLSSDNKVNVRWTTAMEKNVRHFVIERSADGREFTDAGLVYAYGNTSDQTSYSFTDNKVSFGQATIFYYRLRSEDIDGKKQYSQLRVIRLAKGEQKIAITSFPNPVTNELQVSIPRGWQGKKVSYEVLANNGRAALKTVSANSSQTETLNVNHLTTGFYMVKVTCGEEVAVQKIIKR